jgi:perosamine synthetase
LRKQRVAETLGLDGIATRPFFYPLSSLPAFAHLETAAAAAARNRIAYGIAPWAINLPSALSLTEAQVDFVCDRLHTLVASSKAA